MTHPRSWTKASFTVILTSIPTHFPVLHERCPSRTFESIDTIARMVAWAIRSILPVWVSSAFWLHLCNREIFLFDLDHERYEAHLWENFQVQETISGFKTWAWASNFDIDTHNKHHWFHAIHSCSWCDCKRTSYRWRQCERSALAIAPLSVDLLLSTRPLIISGSPPRFPLWRSVIFLL